jgi:hypothetical protein
MSDLNSPLNEPILGGTSTSSTNKIDLTEDVVRQLQLNLRISTLQEGTGGNNHVSKVMI